MHLDRVPEPRCRAVPAWDAALASGEFQRVPVGPVGWISPARRDIFVDLVNRTEKLDRFESLFYHADMSAHEAGSGLTERPGSTSWQPVPKWSLTPSWEGEGVPRLLDAAASRAAPLDRESRSAGSRSDDAPVPPREISPGGGPELAVRVLNQLALSAWLPAALFAGSVIVLIQFRHLDSIDISRAVRTLTAAPIQALALAIPLFLLTKVLAQAFSFQAIRTLEGYWRKRGPASLARTLMIRRHVRRKEAIIRRRRMASQKAFYAAKRRMTSKGIPRSIIDAFEAQVLQRDMPSLTDEEARRFAKMNWRTLCDAWHLATVDHLLSRETGYPATSRVLPTKLGNLIRATEDTLENAAGDVEGFALRHHGKMPQRLQMQHDQFRRRLDMFCMMVFVGMSLLVLTPVILVGSRVDTAAIVVISGSFAVFSAASYLAAIASAGGYCVVMKQMDETSRIYRAGADR